MRSLAVINAFIAILLSLIVWCWNHFARNFSAVEPGAADFYTELNRAIPYKSLEFNYFPG